MTDLMRLPDDLPIPADDGGADHLLESRLPAVALQATTGENVDLSESTAAWLVLFVYPMTGRPDLEPTPSPQGRRTGLAPETTRGMRVSTRGLASLDPGPVLSQQA